MKGRGGCVDCAAGSAQRWCLLRRLEARWDLGFEGHGRPARRRPPFACPHLPAPCVPASSLLPVLTDSSGSIMVTAEETAVIDPEFAFYGPIAFDVAKVSAVHATH